jgi:WD40 repeat protein
MKSFKCLFSRVFSLSVNPNWSESQYFAVINSDFHVLVYDFNSGEVIKGHKGHEKEQNSIPPTALAFLSQNAILSSINSSVVYFDLPTNSFKFFFNLSSRNPITIFKQSPIDSNLVAAGTKNGLILLLKVDKMQIIARLRQHDTEICSLDWFYFTKKSSLANVSLSNLIADSSDCFDIYEDLREDNEFGVTRGGFDDSDLEAREKVTSDANFDFLEACKSLKDQILEEPAEEIQDKTEKYQENRDQYGIKDKKCEPEVSSEDSIASNASSRTPHLTSDSDDAPEKKEFVFVSKKDVRSCDEIAMLASGSKEQFIWIWNIDEKVSIHKISYHPKKQSALPQPFTNVMWMNQENLIITDGNGNLNEYNINFDFKTKKITSKLNQNKRFYIQGVLNLCRYEDNIWTSSIHRNISCIDYKTNKKVISLDTIQLRIHYLVENHFDSNLIAIGGNDKRICLWNTSQATKQEISLRPFMNKIKCAVLCLSWHPEKENLLAFSTREGRIGILDVNKSTNVPIILPSFQSKEVYSISWKKIDDDIVLFACDRQNFVSFSQKNNWKLNKNYNHLKQIASIAFKENLAILGNDSGEILICKIDEDFKILSQKKLSKKYIGMMTLHGSNLAVAVESGFYLIENFGDEILDENLIHFDDNQSRTFTVKFNKNGNLIVSASDDGLVRVFDIEKREKISSYNLNTPVYAALFMPNNEDFIICGGNDSTLVSYEWKNYQDSVNNNLKSKKKGKANKSIQWATASEITTTAKNSQRQKKLKVENVDELSKEIDKISLKDKKSSSLFTSANRELTVDPLEFIERMLTPGDRVKSFHEQIFGDRENVKKLLDDESKLTFEF